MSAEAAFLVRNLSVLSYAQGFTLWYYRYGGPLSDIGAQGYFNPAADMLATGDMILVSANNGGCVAFINSDSERVALAPLVQP